MNPMARSDLDGSTLHVVAKDEVWIIYHGARHYVAGPKVFDALFESIPPLKALDSVDDIILGPALNEGSCLVQADGDSSIYLVTGQHGPGVRRHKIDGPQSWVDFGFSLNRVLKVPFLVLSGLPYGRELQSHGTRKETRAR